MNIAVAIPAQTIPRSPITLKLGLLRGIGDSSGLAGPRAVERREMMSAALVRKKDML